MACRLSNYYSGKNDFSYFELENSLYYFSLFIFVGERWNFILELDKWVADHISLLDKSRKQWDGIYNDRNGQNAPAESEKRYT